MEKQKRLVFLAQEVMVEESDQLDPVFLHVHFKLADNCGNLNREGITEAFIRDLIMNQEKYVCLPMYVDMDRLLSGDFSN